MVLAGNVFATLEFNFIDYTSRIYSREGLQKVISRRSLGQGTLMGMMGGRKQLSATLGILAKPYDPPLRR